MDDMLTDRVSLIKKSGNQIDDIYASVQGERIFIADTSLPIEEGDTLIRILPNKIQERYLILNAKYYIHPDLGHVEIDVRKETKIRDTNLARVEYHQHGDTGQVNIHSPGASQKTINITQGNVFEQLSSVIEKTVSNPDEKSKLLNNVEELKTEQGKKGFLEKYANFIASAANHATLWVALSPFIPILQAMIH